MRLGQKITLGISSLALLLMTGSLFWVLKKSGPLPDVAQRQERPQKRKRLPTKASLPDWARELVRDNFQPGNQAGQPIKKPAEGKAQNLKELFETSKSRLLANVLWSQINQLQVKRIDLCPAERKDREPEAGIKINNLPGIYSLGTPDSPYGLKKLDEHLWWLSHQAVVDSSNGGIVAFMGKAGMAREADLVMRDGSGMGVESNGNYFYRGSEALEGTRPMGFPLGELRDGSFYSQQEKIGQLDPWRTFVLLYQTSCNSAGQRRNIPTMIEFKSQEEKTAFLRAVQNRWQR